MAKPKFTHWEMGFAVFWFALWGFLSLLVGYETGKGYSQGAPGFAGTHPLLWALIPFVPGVAVWAVIVLIVRFAFANPKVRGVVLVAVPVMVLFWLAYTITWLPP